MDLRATDNHKTTLDNYPEPPAESMKTESCTASRHRVQGSGTANITTQTSKTAATYPVFSLTTPATSTTTINASTLETRMVSKEATRQRFINRTPTFDFLFAEKAGVKALLASKTSGANEVILISHPDDLHRYNLVYRLMISEPGSPQLQPGKLFVNEAPLTLVLDIRTLTNDELPRFNDLLDPNTPSLYDRITGKKRLLGQHVRLLVVADPQQLNSSSPDDRVPGADFWRRINYPDNSWHLDDPPTETDTPLLPDYQESYSEDHPPESLACTDVTTINFHLSPDWHRLLYGGPGVGNDGKIRYLSGQLETLQPGQRVIFKGADWENLTFEQSIRLLLTRRQFECNGEQRYLPDGIQFFRTDVSQQELKQLLQPLLCNTVPEKPLIINNANLATWLDGIKINAQGDVEPNRSLVNQIQAGNTITVTSALSEEGWFRLLGVLHSIHHQTGLKPTVILAHLKNQPENLGIVSLPEASTDPAPHPLSELCRQLCRSEQLEIITYQQEAQPIHWLQLQPSAPLVIRVNQQTTFAQLFDNIHITSEKFTRFGRQPTALQAALHSGRPIVIRGLETNESLQQLLEPLCCGQPLLIHGVLHPLPNAHITVFWPANTQSTSPLWNQWLASAQPCNELDLWERAAIRHGIDRNALPDEAIQGIYQAFSTVGPCVTPRPGQLPPVTATLLDQLIRSANQTKQLDQAENLQAVHWRKAINSVITHGTRCNPTVRAFMKFACEQLLPDYLRSNWVDTDYLARTLSDGRPINQKNIHSELIWPLLRAFDPQFFCKTKNTQVTLSFHVPKLTPRAAKLLPALIVAYAPTQLRASLARQLQIDSFPIAKNWQLWPRPSIQIKRLEDALASGWCLRIGGQTRSQIITQLASACFTLTRDASLAPPTVKQRIRDMLSQTMVWTGSKDAPLEELTEGLYCGQIAQGDREQRRLHRLRLRLGQSPIIFLEGETGTGKSYFAAKLAKSTGPAFIVSIGPVTTEQSLINRWRWQVTGDQDRCMVRQHQVLLQWANTRPSCDDEYITLVIDEANLARPGLLDALQGLWQNSPCIYEGGHPLAVTHQHRVILTGNPEHYSGRRLDPGIKTRLSPVHYPSLDAAFLHDRIIEPALRQHFLLHMSEHKAGSLAQQASYALYALWHNFSDLLPDHEFTPRDLTDICAWVGWYLNQAQLNSIADPLKITLPGLHGLIQQSYRDLLGPEVSRVKHNFHVALDIWFQTRFATEQTLVERVQQNYLAPTVVAFRMKTNDSCPKFDSSVQAVIELVQQLARDLSRCQQAYHWGRKHGGRQATLIEGPAGRGKDATLQLLIDSYREQVRQRQEKMPPVDYLNAGDCPWETLCSHIDRARAEGRILVISELNLIDSQYVEGELNDILAGEAHPGFHLFATINPGHYKGRKALTPALMGRFRHIPIRAYNSEELNAIARKILSDSAIGKWVATRLSHWHCALKLHLERQKPWLQPTSLDLQRLAETVARSGDFSESSLEQQASRHYRLYLMAAGCELNQLPEPPTDTPEERPVDPELCQWFSATLCPDDRPWLIERSNVGSSININCRTITVAASLATEPAQQEVIKMLARAQWEQSGLPADPQEDDDTLVQAIYRRWQHQWFARNFANTDLNANDVFLLDSSQRLTLAIETNQHYLAEAKSRLCSAEMLKAVNTWPGAWASCRDMLDYPTSSYQTLKPDTDTGKDSVDDEHSKEEDAINTTACLPIHQKKSTLDKHTGYETEAKPSVHLKKIFSGNDHPALYRMAVITMDITDEGDITTTHCPFGKHGFEAIIPKVTLPEQGEIPLTRGEHLATLTLTVTAGQWQPLPSLNPEEAITALRTSPSTRCHIIRDRYTGLHLISIPEARDNQPIKIMYIVKQRNTSYGLYHTKPVDHKEPRSDSHCSATIKTILDRLFDENSQIEMPESQRQQLQAIRTAPGESQKIDKITEYFRVFRGQSNAAPKTNFFDYLMRSRQGSCRHRAPSCVALCLYFGINARLVQGDHHCYVEVSTNNGHTWCKKDLGGAPVKNQFATSELPPLKEGMDIAFPKKLAQHLLLAPLAQRNALARVMGIDINTLNDALKNGMALPQPGNSDSTMAVSIHYEAGTNPAQPICHYFAPYFMNHLYSKEELTLKIVRKLWRAPDMASFATACDLLIYKDQLNVLEINLTGVGARYNKINVLRHALIYLLLHEEKVSPLIKKINELYVRLFSIPNTRYTLFSWQSLIVDSLTRILNKRPAALMRYSRDFAVHYEYLIYQYASLKIDDGDGDSLFTRYEAKELISKALTLFFSQKQSTNEDSEKTCKNIYHRSKSVDLTTIVDEYADFLYDTDSLLSQKYHNVLSKELCQKTVFLFYCTGYFYYNNTIQFNELISILADSAMTERINTFCFHALSSGWLEPRKDPDYVSDIGSGGSEFIFKHYNLLRYLKNGAKTKEMATICQQKWHATYLGQEQFHKFMAKRNILNFAVSGDYGGHSPLLEAAIATRTLSSSWSNEPDGMPDIERLLIQAPAFPTLASQNTAHRHAIITGFPDWSKTSIEQKNSEILERVYQNRPDLKQLHASSETDDCRLVNMLKKPLEFAFCQYLFRTTHSKGGNLGVCWLDADVSIIMQTVQNTFLKFPQTNQCGYYKPKSPEELAIMLSIISNEEDDIDEYLLLKTHNAEGGIVLNKEKMTTIACEFIDSVDMHSLCAELLVSDINQTCEG